MGSIGRELIEWWIKRPFLSCFWGKHPPGFKAGRSSGSTGLDDAAGPGYFRPSSGSGKSVMIEAQFPVLTCLIVLPLLGCLGLLFFKNPQAIRCWGLGVSLAEILLALPLLHFRMGTADFQFVESVQWVSSWGLRYFLGGGRHQCVHGGIDADNLSPFALFVPGLPSRPGSRNFTSAFLCSYRF